MCVQKKKNKVQKHMKYNVSTLEFVNMAGCRREEDGK